MDRCRGKRRALRDARKEKNPPIRPGETGGKHLKNRMVDRAQSGKVHRERWLSLDKKGVGKKKDADGFGPKELGTSTAKKTNQQKTQTANRNRGAPPR